MGIELLEERDGLERWPWRNKEILIHEDHRWVLPLVVDAQQRGLLPRPVPVALFDRHTDCAQPRRPLPAIATVEDALRLCEDHLSPHDDDWLIAGIETGILADVFLFGVDDRMGDLPLAVGNQAVFGRWEMPGFLPEVGVNARRLLEGSGPILLDIDLDCFAYAYRDQVWPWSEEIFAHQFSGEQTLWRSLVQRAGLITVCREAGCCGGDAHADRIWNLCRKFLFT